MNSFDVGFFAVIAAGLLLVVLLLSVSRRRPVAPRAGGGGKFLAGLLIAAGVGGLAYFFLFFDTSVAVDAQVLGIRRVNNLGLMNTQRNGIIISAVVLLAGVILAVTVVRPGGRGQRERAPRDEHAGLYILRGETAEGPFSLAQLRVLAEMGKINAETLCAREGGDEWQPVGRWL